MVESELWIALWDWADNSCSWPSLSLVTENTSEALHRYCCGLFSCPLGLAADVIWVCGSTIHPCFFWPGQLLSDQTDQIDQACNLGWNLCPKAISNFSGHRMGRNGHRMGSNGHRMGRYFPKKTLNSLQDSSYRLVTMSQRYRRHSVSWNLKPLLCKGFILFGYLWIRLFAVLRLP